MGFNQQRKAWKAWDCGTVKWGCGARALHLHPPGSPSTVGTPAKVPVDGWLPVVGGGGGARALPPHPTQDPKFDDSEFKFRP